MFILFRTLTYASLFTALLLVFVPVRILERSGITTPDSFGVIQVIGIVLAVMGAGIAFSCVLTFALFGRGTPAPFDPPRRLVLRGPYGIVRNPMYLGAGLALIGAALFYSSTGLLTYACLFLLSAHLLVIFYEEPTLRRTFGAEYEEYVRRVRRWLPRVPIHPRPTLNGGS